MIVESKHLTISGLHPVPEKYIELWPRYGFQTSLTRELGFRFVSRLGTSVSTAGKKREKTSLLRPRKLCATGKRRLGVLCVLHSIG